MTHDPTDIRAQERAKAQASQHAKNARDTEEADVKWLMGSKRGRRIVWRLLDQAGVFRLSFNTNAMQMAFNEGGRNAGLRLLGLINATCPELYQTMITEQQADDGREHHADD